MNNVDAQNINILSLFSGGGFLDIGFLNQGYNINQAIEINPFFIDCYNEGIKSYYTNTNSISKGLYSPIETPFDASTKQNQKIIKSLNHGVSGIIGGPPCQDYSIGGNNAGMEGERGKLIYSYFEIVKNVNPEFIFFENVPGLYNTKVHQIAFLDLVSRLEKVGYCVWYTILNSLNFGIPQDRPRLTLVGFKKDIVKKLKKAGYKDLKEEVKSEEEFIFKWPKKIIENPKNIKWPSKWEFGSDIIEQDLSLIPDDHKNLQIISAFQGLTMDMPNQDEFFVPKSHRFNTVHEGDTNRKSFKRLHRYRYSPTVAYGNNEVHLHPTEARRISVREALRIQSVPDSYVLPKDIPLTHKFKVISNGVPTHKSELIAQEIRRTLENFRKL
ncbi:DNA cytosine methyltransferase [Flavobacterium suzhouense]|uniref:DNA (cytosine-5-)-methyltransferase n=1 Tax=Flavobacterium suzhouense TaxID=1529638 RepID=A0ABW5NRV8_9FLAO